MSEDTVWDTFTARCPWGCTTHVWCGKEQPHACTGTAILVDLLRMGAIDPGQTYGEIAERLARGLDSPLRAILAERSAVPE